MRETQTSFLELALQSGECSSDVFGQLIRITQSLGFEFCAYGVRAPVPISRPVVGMFNNYPQEWQERYLTENYLAIDPTVRRALRASAPIPWAGDVLQEAPGFWDEARSAGLRYGWALPCHDQSGTIGLVSFARRHEPLSESELKAKSVELIWTAHLAHLTISKQWLATQVPEVNRCITAREREVLRWTAEGKTSYETGQIMNVSERTVNFHISNAVAKLGATNKTQAAVKAAVLGMLF